MSAENTAKFCKHCGAALVAGSRYCDMCGRQVESGAGSVKPPFQVDTAGVVRPACPKCGQTDAVIKAKTFYEEELMTQREHWQGEENGGQEENQMTLAEQLAPPPEPDVPSASVFWYVLPFVPPLNALLIWFAPMAGRMKKVLIGLGGLAVVGWVIKFRLEASYTGPIFMLPSELREVAGLTILDLPFLAVLAMLIVYYSGLILMNRQLAADYRTGALQDWQRANKRWNSLFYCARCRGAFTDEPVTGKKNFTDLNGIESLLNDKMPANTDE